MTNGETVYRNKDEKRDKLEKGNERFICYVCVRNIPNGLAPASPLLMKTNLYLDHFLQLEEGVEAEAEVP
jgi:hypothetical protein